MCSSDLQYKITYKKGQENVVADALSRCNILELNTVSRCTPAWLDNVSKGYFEDEQAQKLLAMLAGGTILEAYSLKQGIIYHKGRIWLGNNEEMQKQIMGALHSSDVGGHSGFPVTYHRVKKLFSWPKMKAHIKKFVASCATCQQAKVERVKYPGLLQPLKVPPGAWHTVAMDFIEGLPKSGKYDYLLVVVDKFSKYAHFMPLSHPYTAASVAQAYLDGIYRLHGMPIEIVSDRDPVFTSHFWKELARLTGVQLDMSSGQHPQSDGQTERVN